MSGVGEAEESPGKTEDAIPVSLKESCVTSTDRGVVYIGVG